MQKCITEIGLPKQEDLCSSLPWKYKSQRVYNFDLHLVNKMTILNNTASSQIPQGALYDEETLECGCIVSLERYHIYKEAMRFCLPNLHVFHGQTFFIIKTYFHT